MVDLHTLPAGSRPQSTVVRNNGPDNLALERYKLRELADGWPAYRDACEWENLKSIFSEDAIVYTTWTGRTHYLDFIKASQDGIDDGVFIIHRINGSTTDISVSAIRAVTKMKATISQRVTLPCDTPTGAANKCEVDVENDCRFCFFWERQQSQNGSASSGAGGEWRARYVRLWYERDKIIPVDPRRILKLDDTKLAKFPVGYRYIGYCQEVTMGVNIPRDLPRHLRETILEDEGAKMHDVMYWQCKQWLEGQEIQM